MPRNPTTGTYTLPESAYIPNTTIQSASVNANLSDIATALTQSLATTGQTSMTGPIKAASGTVTAPSLTFSSANTTGFYLSGTNEFSWAAAGVLAATFAADKSVTWAGAQVLQSTLNVAGAATLTSGTLAGRPITALDVGTVGIFGQTAAPTGWTKLTNLDNAALRVVSGAAGSGGTVDFSTLFARTATDAHTLTLAQMPTHGHTLVYSTTSGAESDGSGGLMMNDTNVSSNLNTGAASQSAGSQISGAGSSQSHTHDIDMRVKYVDVIRATKD